MPTGAEGLQGPRLEFVVRKLPGTVTRLRRVPPPTELERKENPRARDKELGLTSIEVQEDAGYMLYTPQGMAYRLTGKELVRRNFDREPNIIGFEQANDLKTPAGRFKLARTDAARQKAWLELEKQVMDACLGKLGKVDAMVSDYDPSGKVKEAA